MKGNLTDHTTEVTLQTFT